MTKHEPNAAIQERFPGAVLGREGSSLVVDPAHLVEIGEFLRDETGLAYDLMATLTKVNDRICYQLASLGHRRRLCLHVPAANTDDMGAIDSLAFIWPAANWAEREAHELWSAPFRGHPQLSPLLTHARSPQVLWAEQANGVQLANGTRYPTSTDGWCIHLEQHNGRVTRAEPELGYRHVGLEKRLVQWDCTQATLLMARVDGFSAMHGGLAYALAVEKLARIEPPPRAQRLRVIYAELERVASHLFWLVRVVQNLTDPLFVAASYAWEARTMILDLFQWLGGNPITPDLISVGGLRCDAPVEFASKLARLGDELGALLDDMRHLLDHQAFYAQMEGIGVLDPGTAVGLGVTGPCLRASGIGYDVRIAFPYADYAALHVPLPTERHGDARSRYRVRIAETQASLELIRQAASRLPAGPINALETGTGENTRPSLSGETYASVEGPRGELGVYMVANGSPHPGRVHVRGPSFANLSALSYILRQEPVRHAAPILDSLDISAGEAAR
jgi:NADH-quinone oxidoreductase subunit D